MVFYKENNTYTVLGVVFYEKNHTYTVWGMVFCRKNNVYTVWGMVFKKEKPHIHRFGSQNGLAGIGTVWLG